MLAFPRIEAFGLLLARFRSAGDMFELSMQYNRSQAAISQLINELSEFLDERWSHLLSPKPSTTLMIHRIDIVSMPWLFASPVDSLSLVHGLYTNGKMPKGLPKLEFLNVLYSRYEAMSKSEQDSTLPY
ncbi:hypothetical protein R3P38DRAFT_2811153 [Favolaschia claudopus]|uniref:Transposase Helix-turn-helix domain-containing protein n=1 Tax=Favolaschia claudopus TaxID=2862362 RepID=A0AAV9Z9E0_9AGAR